MKAHCSKLAEKLETYRAADGYAVDADHVSRWIYQFDEEVREPLLSEMCHVIDATYYSEEEVRNFFANQISNGKFAGPDAKEFWRSANILGIQGQGQSQAEISKQFFRSLKAELDLSPVDCGRQSDTFIYLDDAVFSGSRAGGDLVKWLKADAPASGVVKILVIATYQ